MFLKFSGEEFENFSVLAEKLRSDYKFGHTLDAKLLTKGELSVNRPTIRLFKPFDELFVDFQVSWQLIPIIILVILLYDPIIAVSFCSCRIFRWMLCKSLLKQLVCLS